MSTSPRPSRRRFRAVRVIVGVVVVLIVIGAVVGSKHSNTPGKHAEKSSADSTKSSATKTTTTATVPGTSAVVTVPSAATVPRARHGRNGHAYYVIARNSKPLTLDGVGSKATAGLIVLSPSRVFWACAQCTELPAGGGVIGFATRGVDVTSAARSGSFALNSGAYEGIAVVTNGVWSLSVAPEP